MTPPSQRENVKWGQKFTTFCLYCCKYGVNFIAYIIDNCF
jgi:hypothetical protein